MEEATALGGNGMVVQVRDLVKQFGSVTVVDHITNDCLVGGAPVGSSASPGG